MKRILRIGEGYALSKIYSSLLAIATTMCLYAVKQVSAQEAEPAATAVTDIKPLQIGDTIPEHLWHLPLQVVNLPPTGGKDIMTLNDHRDKLIILDFWATWCGPCISSLYKLDTLQKQFAGELAVIPTTYEASEKTDTFIAGKGWSLPSVVEETNLKKYFPHQSIPHQVWIKSGRVGAIVGPEYANKSVIEDVLVGKNIAFNHKTEVPFDKTRPLFLGGNGGEGGNMLYQSIISGRLQARVGGVSSPFRNQLLAYNRTIEQLYKIAFEQILSPQISGRYIIYEVDDTLKNRISPANVLSMNNKLMKEQWSEENLYCYNLVLPRNCDNKAVSERMLYDLNNFFGSYLNLRISYEPRQLKCLAIVKTEKFQDISTKGGPNVNRWDAKKEKLIFQNEPLATLVYYMNIALTYNEKLNLEPYPYPLVDETGIAGNVDLRINANLRDFESVSRELSKYGLDLVEKTAVVNMIVFKQINKPIRK